jgi:hypothetical protein
MEHVRRDDISLHGRSENECAARYSAWRREFVPVRTKVAFIGLSPPVPDSATDEDIGYIYKDPDSHISESKTSIRWRNSLEVAFMCRPELRTHYRQLGEYLLARRSLKKRPFLEALRNSQFEWIDCVEFPVKTERVNALLSDPEFTKRFGRDLAERGYSGVAFLSHKQGALKEVFCKEILKSDGVPTTILPKTLWSMSAFDVGPYIAELLVRIEQQGGED